MYLNDDNNSISSENENPELFQDINNEKRWRLKYLKQQFESLALGGLFERYLERISHGYFSQFLSLQIILITAHLITLTIISNANDVYPDIILYALISFFSILLIIATDTYVKEHPKLLKIFAGTSFILILFTNFFIPFYYRNRPNKSIELEFANLRPAYTTYILICNYILLNVHNNNKIALLIGLCVSTFHIVTLILVTYKDSNNILERIVADGVYLGCINMLGLYFRYMNEIVIRRSFLDRQSCVVSTNQLEYEEKQENQLMSSIIPSYILEPVKKSHLLASINGTHGLTDELHILHHKNVTILFADIVNYTAMTTKLNIKDLLQVLNELFGRFDDASDELNVLRIKFLGDCYYCVSGLPPTPSPKHAEACVDLGLKMIDIIADVRRRKNLDINMRIGIHSGQINSGVIGKVKWQYDVWSTDVDLANRMETDGKAGKVHITQATKDLLTKAYNMEATDRGTYLISPNALYTIPEEPVVVEKAQMPRNESSDSLNQPSERRTTIYVKKHPFPDLRRQSTPVIGSSAEVEAGDLVHRVTETPINYRRPSLHISPVDRRLTHGDGKRRTAFMNSNLKRYKEGLEKTNKNLKQTIEEMRLTKFEQWFHLDEMNRLLLTFKNWKREKNFLTAPDPLFKYYLLTEIILLFLVYIIENLTLVEWEWPTWPFWMSFGLLVFVGLPLCWTHYLWKKYSKHNEAPTNPVLLFFYKMSILITQKFYFRFIIYIIIYTSFCLCVLSEWVQCEKIHIFDDPYLTREKKESFLTLLTKTKSPETNVRCIVPWHMTETCGLAIIMSFLFLRMHMFIKLVFASIITTVYCVCVWLYSDNFYDSSQTFNYLVKPQVAHTLSVVILTVTLHLVDRQTEYMNRLDYGWYESLIEKQRKASQVRNENSKLLQNILPLHVAKIYLNLDMDLTEDRLYRESYNNAAVVFASITNVSVENLGRNFLKVMNDVICEFDLLTVGNQFGRPIEKIKVAKWTYMAACGLVPGFGNTRNIELDQNSDPVIALLHFATNLMQKLPKLNREHLQDMKLRIGISHGSLAAGVVGSRKPLYDIWGDPVNMASRMDSTGVVDRIQVLEETAKLVESFGYLCEYRGLVEVKGREHKQHTYFVCLDENYHLIKKHEQ